MLKLTKIDGWQAGKLSDIADIVSGGTPSRNIPEYWSPGVIPWVTPTDITKDSSLYLNGTSETISEIGLKRSSANLLPPGSVLMTSRATLGFSKIALVPTCTNQGFKSLVPKAGNSGLFLKYWMEFTKKHYTDLGTGTTFMEINKRDTENFPVHLVPHKEQKRIAEILSAVDEQIEILISLQSKLRIEWEAVAESEFSLISKDQFLPLSECLDEFVNGYAFSASQYVDSGVPIITMGNISLEGKFLFNKSKLRYWKSHKGLEKFILSFGDLIIPMTDVTPGRNLIGRVTAYNRYEASLLNQRVGKIVLNGKLTPDFFRHYANSHKWRKYCKAVCAAGVQANLSTVDIKAGLVPVIELSRQRAISNTLNSIEEKEISVSQNIEKLKLLKSSLMNDLLTGKTRVLS